jgi:hypothetical protein
MLNFMLMKFFGMMNRKNIILLYFLAPVARRSSCYSDR